MLAVEDPAVQRRRLQLDDLFRVRRIGAMTVRPGTHVVFFAQQQASARDNGYISRIMRVTPGEPPQPVTAGPQDSDPQVSPDGRWLAFLSPRAGSPQIWVMDLVQGGEAWALTRHATAVREFAWAPDSRRLAYVVMVDQHGLDPPPRPDPDDYYAQYTRDVQVITELHYKRDGEGYRGARRPQIAVVDLRPGAVPRLLTEPPAFHRAVTWTPDGRLLLVARRGPDYDAPDAEPALYGMSPEGGKAVRLTPKGLAVEAARVSPDGRTIALLARRSAEMGYDNLGLYRLPADSREPPQRIALHWDRPFEDVAVHDMPTPAHTPLAWDKEGRHVYALSSTEGRTQVVRVDTATGAVEALTDADAVHYSLAVAPDGPWAAVAASSPDDPSRLFGLDLRPGRGKPASRELLAAPNAAWLAQVDLAAPRPLVAQALRGPKVDTYVMEPVGREAGRRYPAVLSIHGGPMQMYGWAFSFEFQWLAANGYAVVYANPRGSQGYGFEFCRAVQTEWGKKDLADLYAALDTTLARAPWIDPDRLGVAGGSYGGFMTNWIVGHSDRFKAAVSMRPIVDWRSLVGTGDGGWRWLRRAGGKGFWEDDSWYRQQSPISYVAHIVTPLLIEQQEDDLRCPSGQGEMLYSLLKYLGRAPVRLIRYPGESHGMSRDGRPWHRVHRLRQILEWFDTYLKPEV